ncbi:hypothetical protein ACLKA7_002616 [Drosophila subpalustris]
MGHSVGSAQREIINGEPQRLKAAAVFLACLTIVAVSLQHGKHGKHGRHLVQSCEQLQQSPEAAARDHDNDASSMQHSVACSVSSSPRGVPLM